MKQLKSKNIFKVHIFLALILLLAVIGCGGGGGYGSGGGELGENGSISPGNYDEPSLSSPSEDPPQDPISPGSATLSWDEPFSNSDGSDLDDLAGYKIYYGESSNNYTQSIDVGNITSAVISNLPFGTWCFATTAYDEAGNESDYSNEACATI